MPKVCEKIKNHTGPMVFTIDQHVPKGYFHTVESKIPIHCVPGTDGYKVHPDICEARKDTLEYKTIQKRSFGYNNWVKTLEPLRMGGGKIILCGLVTDCCVLANAVIIRNLYPSVRIEVDASCCAGTTPEMHKLALQIMRQQLITVVNYANDSSGFSAGVFTINANNLSRLAVNKNSKPCERLFRVLASTSTDFKIGDSIYTDYPNIYVTEEGSVAHTAYSALETLYLSGELVLTEVHSCKST